MRAKLLLPVLATALTIAGAAAGATSDLQMVPATRLPFPERGYVVSVSERATLDARDVVVRENGIRVRDVSVDPLAGSGLRFGVVLAIDASESMTGAPATAALSAAREFVARRAETQEIGVLAFNGRLSVLTDVTRDGDKLRRTLATEPTLAYGTRIHDAVMRSLELLKGARLSSGSIVLLSDGADIGSVSSLDAAIEAARKQQVRVFTVGLRSEAFDARSLQSIAESTGGSFAEARSTSELAEIYDELGARLAGEYLVRYRSSARPMSQVDVQIHVAGAGKGAAAYVAPTPSLLPPYHRSALTRFLLSPASPLVMAFVIATLICLLLLALGRRPRTTVVDRVQRFSADPRPARSRTEPVNAAGAAAAKAVHRNQYSSGWWARLERDLELARMEVTPQQVVGLALAGMVLIAGIAFMLSMPVFGIFAIASPLLARAIVQRKLAAVRADFADQFPSSLQVLASALRSGHSFNGALGVVVENAQEPARSELARVLQDEQLGVLPEDAIRKLGRRMANRDIEQVALLAELQRTTGGNSAEILDTVVSTIRERAEIRRLVRTLTAQGRMARWILTALPVFLTTFLWIVHPDVMSKFFTSGGGQIALVVATLMVASGSIVIQRIVDIDV